MALSPMREGHLSSKKLILLHDTQSASKRSGATRIGPKFQPSNTHGNLHFQRFDRQVHAVGSVGFDHVYAITASYAGATVGAVNCPPATTTALVIFRRSAKLEK